MSIKRNVFKLETITVNVQSVYFESLNRFPGFICQLESMEAYSTTSLAIRCYVGDTMLL